MRGQRVPLVGITGRKIRAPEAPCRFGQNQAYVDAVARAGAVPLILPLVVEPAALRAVYDRLDGVLLPGGEDVDPARYGEPRHERCGASCADRDEVELALARWAVEDGKPLLAICRGIQVLNVALGGSLYQDLGTQRPEALEHAHDPQLPRDYRAHPVALVPTSHLARLMGTTSMAVNSLHHQAIKDLAARLSVTAWAPDGVIEAAELRDHPFGQAVQWHPEELEPGDPKASWLFAAFADACRR